MYAFGTVWFELLTGMSHKVARTFSTLLLLNGKTKFLRLQRRLVLLNTGSSIANWGPNAPIRVYVSQIAPHPENN